MKVFEENSIEKSIFNYFGNVVDKNRAFGIISFFYSNILNCLGTFHMLPLAGQMH